MLIMYDFMQDLAKASHSWRSVESHCLNDTLSEQFSGNS